jgi:hypothetical protein
VAFWIVSRSARYGIGFISSIDVGHNDSLNSPVEMAQDRRIRVVRYSGDRRNAEYLGGTHHVFDLIQIHRAVLAVDHYEIVAQRPEQFYEIRSVTTDDGPENHLTSVEFRFGGVSSHSSP